MEVNTKNYCVVILERFNNVPNFYRDGVRDVLVIRQSYDTLIQVEIRINGYLLDLITVKRNILRVYTLSDITEGLDMTLKYNRTFRDFDFFEKLK